MGGVKIPITSTKAAFLSVEAQILHATAGWGHISPQTDGHWCLQLNSFEQRLSHGSRMHGLPHGKGQAPWGHFHTHDSAHEGQGSWHFRPQLIILILLFTQSAHTVNAYTLLNRAFRREGTPKLHGTHPRKYDRKGENARTSLCTFLHAEFWSLKQNRP